MVREGAPGFADDGEYKSHAFDSFDECFISYINFKPYKHWKNLRHIQSEQFVYVNNDIKYITKAHDGMLNYNDAEVELGITESKFDEIIYIINQMIDNNKTK